MLLKALDSTIRTRAKKTMPSGLGSASALNRSLMSHERLSPAIGEISRAAIDWPVMDDLLVTEYGVVLPIEQTIRLGPKPVHYSPHKQDRIYGRLHKQKPCFM